MLDNRDGGRYMCSIIATEGWTCVEGRDGRHRPVFCCSNLGQLLAPRFQPLQLKDWYTDEYTGDVLDPKLIREAMIEDLDYFNS